MAKLDLQNREIAIKLVYYGPAMSGKTTNLQMIHQRINKEKRDKLHVLGTQGDRTLYFDLVPLSFHTASGLTCRLKLFTVPGQVVYEMTRKVVLQNADGVAFIADSQLSETEHNEEALKNLRQNLKENHLDTENIPIVFQYNKRDLREICSDADIGRFAQRFEHPVFRAIAIRGQGVVDTLLGLANATWESLERRIGLGSKHNVPKGEFLTALGKQLGHT